MSENGNAFKMKHLITALIFITFSVVNAQSTEELREIGLTISPDFFMNENVNSVINSNGNVITDIKLTKFNYTAGLIFNTAIRKHFSFIIGINYSQKEVEGVYVDTCITCNNTESIQEKLALRYAEIPLLFRQYIVDRKVNVFGEIGLVNSILLKKAETELGQELPANSYLLNVQAGLGVSVNLTDRFNAGINSIYKKSFSKTFDISDYQFENWGLQLSIALRI